MLILFVVSLCFALLGALIVAVEYLFHRRYDTESPLTFWTDLGTYLIILGAAIFCITAMTAGVYDY